MHKKLRVFFALLLTAPLVYFYAMPRADEAFTKVSHLQIVQLLLELRGGNFLPFAVILAVLLISVLMYGRIYCSTVCPLGTIQDIFIRLRGIVNRKGFKYKKPVRGIPLLFLAVYILLYILGMNILLTLFEPFTNAARILSFFPSRDVLALSISAVTGLFLFAAVMFKGRIFCNTLCPAGSLLSVFARLSVFKLGFDKQACISCGKCEKVCKSECVSVKDKHIDFERCVGCMNCADVCPHKAVKWKRTVLKNTQAPDLKKRELIKTALVTAGLSVVPGKIYASENARKKTVMMPPGAQNIKRFNSLCTSCHACVKVCPQQVIDISLTEYGPLNIFRPKLNYDKSYCLYKCVSCTHACPSGALREMSVLEKKRLAIGKAELDKKKCIGYTKGRTCNVCVEHCPVKAVYAVKYKNNLAPEVLLEICTGCGACEKTCPVRPVKAITVKASEAHGTIPDPARAVRPNEYNLKFRAKKPAKTSDFPF